jgi:hypothetical protein
MFKQTYTHLTRVSKCRPLLKQPLSGNSPRLLTPATSSFSRAIAIRPGRDFCPLATNVSCGPPRSTEQPWCLSMKLEVIYTTSEHCQVSAIDFLHRTCGPDERLMIPTDLLDSTAPHP